MASLRLVPPPPAPEDRSPVAGSLDVAALRRDYARGGLSASDLAPTWHEQLTGWLAVAVAERVPEPNAAVLATASADGVPSGRTVLVKQVDERGLAVFTNLTSRKGREAAENPRASLVFAWLPLERQVVVVGDVEPVDRAEAEAYFHTRPRGAQLGAWASHQSAVIAGREQLEARRAELERRFEGGSVPLPDFWGGLRVVPRTVELWQGRPDRLHDRLRYRRTDHGWVVERLSP
jgi:pyridoxamine 5'-phosphate oxidase